MLFNDKLAKKLIHKKLDEFKKLNKHLQDTAHKNIKLEIVNEMLEQY